MLSCGDLAGAAALPGCLAQTKARTVPGHGGIEEAVHGATQLL